MIELKTCLHTTYWPRHIHFSAFSKSTWPVDLQYHTSQHKPVVRCLQL